MTAPTPTEAPRAGDVAGLLARDIHEAASDAAMRALRNRESPHGGYGTECEREADRQQARSDRLRALAQAVAAVQPSDLAAVANRIQGEAMDADRVAESYEMECDEDDPHDAALLATVPDLRAQSARKRPIAALLRALAGQAGA